jgi:hypothetical protein
MTFASRNLTLDAQSQQESHVKWASLCIEPNAKSLKLFNPQSQPKMPSDTGAFERNNDRNDPRSMDLDQMNQRIRERGKVHFSKTSCCTWGRVCLHPEAKITREYGNILGSRVIVSGKFYSAGSFDRRKYRPVLKGSPEMMVTGRRPVPSSSSSKRPAIPRGAGRAYGAAIIR